MSYKDIKIDDLKDLEDRVKGYTELILNIYPSSYDHFNIIIESGEIKIVTIDCNYQYDEIYDRNEYKIPFSELSQDFNKILEEKKKAQVKAKKDAIIQRKKELLEAIELQTKREKAEYKKLKEKYGDQEL